MKAQPLGLRRVRLRLGTDRYVAVKDPCPVLVGSRWHLFGTGIFDGYQYEILHATATDPYGPWELGPPAKLDSINGNCVAAPGILAEGDDLHMFIQTEYNLLNGRVEHLVSTDDGASFNHHDTALESLPGTGEAGIYDPHPGEVGGERFLVYSGFSVVGRPDIYLARSRTGRWSGPWERLGPILRHEDVPDHNQHNHPAYEWGLEGAQLVGLPDGRVLLTAVCFLGTAPAGQRQRVFFAVADRPLGPYRVLRPALEPARAGETGHATGVVMDGGGRIAGKELAVFFQEREAHGAWRYGLMTAPLRTETGQARRV